MAPQPLACYSTASDIENLIVSNRPVARLPWTACLTGGLLGLACAITLLWTTTGTSLQIQQPLNVAPSAAVTPRVDAPVPAVPATQTLLQKVGNGLAVLSLTAMANLGTPDVAPAFELDLLSTPTPTTEYVFDDGKLLSKTTVGELNSRLPQIEERTGYRINVVTLRRLTSSDDAFQFADNLIETWYPTAELGDKKAVLVIVKNSKEGGLVGGPSFSRVVPDDVLESIVNDNYGKLLAEEKFNQAVSSTLDRLEAVLSGRADPGPPKALFEKSTQQQTSNYKTKEETDSKRSLYVTVFGGLVAISFIAPMVQFFGYTKDDK